MRAHTSECDPRSHSRVESAHARGCLRGGARGRAALAGRRRKFSRGEIVFHEGDPGDSVHRVIERALRRADHDAARRRRDIRRARPRRGLRPARGAASRGAPHGDRGGPRSGADACDPAERLRAPEGRAPARRERRRAAAARDAARPRARASSRRSTRPFTCASARGCATSRASTATAARRPSRSPSARRTWPASRERRARPSTACSRTSRRAAPVTLARRRITIMPAELR